jgi:hypothetical protein
MQKLDCDLHKYPVNNACLVIWNTCHKRSGYVEPFVAGCNGYRMPTYDGTVVRELC